MRARSLLLLGIVLASPELQAASYSWDFRNGHFDNLSLIPLGPGAVNLLKPAKDGLRIAVPRGHNVKTVGFSPRFKIRGDFEITVEFAILSRTPPESGFGTGPSIYLSTGSTVAAAASLSRLLRPDGRDVYGLFAAQVLDGKRTPSARLFDVPEAAVIRDGRLQMKRIGNEITYLTGNGGEAAPEALWSMAVSDEDVTMLRVGLSQSDEKSAATIILRSIRIEADELPHLPSEDSRTAQLYRPRYQVPAAPRSFGWIWPTSAAITLVVGLAVWLWIRRK